MRRLVAFGVERTFNYVLMCFKKHSSIKLIIVFVGLMCFCKPLFSQDKNIKNELLSICKKYISHTDEMSCKIVYNYYNSKSSKVLADKQSGELFLWNSCFIFKFSGTEMIKNEKYYVAINDAEKTVFAGYSPTSNNTPLGIDVLDSLQKNGYLDARFIKGNSTQIKTIRYSINQGRTDSVDINYDPKSYVINNCKLYMSKETKYDDNDKNPVMVIEYQNTQFKLADKGVKEKYYAKKYVEINGKKVILKSACKGYQLVNNLDN